MTQPSTPLPSRTQLMKSTIAAAAMSVAALILVILPAEYGIDPIKSGKLLGLTDLDGSNSTEVVYQSTALGASSAEPLMKFATPIKLESTTLTLDAYDGIEIKLHMQARDHIVFKWHANGDTLYSDMHGEKFDSEDEFSTYWKEKQQSEGSGAFTAPFSGTHGWYWQNMSESPVTIELTVSGIYDSLGEKQ